MIRKVKNGLLAGISTYGFLALSIWGMFFFNDHRLTMVFQIGMVMVPIIAAILLDTAGKRYHALGVAAGALLFVLSLALAVYVYWIK